MKGDAQGGGDLADAVSFGHEVRHFAHHAALDPGQGQLDDPKASGIILRFLRGKDHGGQVVLLFLDLPDRFSLGDLAVRQSPKVDRSIGVLLGPFRCPAKGAVNPRATVKLEGFLIVRMTDRGLGDLPEGVRDRLIGYGKPPGSGLLNLGPDKRDGLADQILLGLGERFGYLTRSAARNRQSSLRVP